VIKFKLTFWFTVAEATTFSMLTIGFVCGIVVALKRTIYIPVYIDFLQISTKLLFESHF
jgi:hypothetical protein